jgi:hypothetical protein
MSGIDRLLILARAYAAAENVEISTVSTRVFDDGKKLAALESGADIQLRRAERALQWFSDRWPAGVEWPEGIERPAAQQEASQCS